MIDLTMVMETIELIVAFKQDDESIKEGKNMILVKKYGSFKAELEKNLN